jgi:hypothetical protein
MEEEEKGEGLCPTCNGRLLPLIECGSCGVKTVREGLQPVQEAEKCPVCESKAKIVFECGDCHETYSFHDIIPEEEKFGCPMCGAFVDPDATECPSCGSSFAVEGMEETAVEAERPRRPRKVVGEYVEEDVQEIMKIPGVGRLRAEVLCKAGYTTLNKLTRSTVDELAKVRQIGMRTAKSIKEALQMMYVEPVESQRLLEESVEEEFECPVCRTIVSAYDTDCSECGTAFERVVQDQAFIEEMEKVGEEKSSLSLFDMKLLENPKDAELWVARGGLLRKMENYEEALKSYDKALKIRPEMKSAWIAKAELLSKLGRLDEAASCYREIVDESATAAGIELGKEEDAMAALEELLAEDCPSCGSTIPLGSNNCPSCGMEFVGPDQELPLEPHDEGVVTEDILEEDLKEEGKGKIRREAAKGPGLTNGKGIVNGKGRINGTGLVNGRGRINGTGMVNGKGLVNGRGIVNGRGRVNGLINGNGFTNGLALSNITSGPGKRTGIKYVVLVIAFAILALGLYGIVPQAEKKVSPITIDGQFQDWSGIDLYTDQGLGPNPDTSITRYGYTIDDGFFSFLVEVQGAALGDAIGYDSFYMFIDRDNNPSTGYIVNNLGADYMVEVFGGAREVVGVPMYRYEDTQDRLNFTQWAQIATGIADVGGNGLEGQLVSNSLFDLSGDFRILFSADDADGGVSYSSINAGPDHGALLITQTEYGQNQIISSGSTEIMQLRFEAKGADVHVDSVSFNVLGALAQPLGAIDIAEGSSTTRTVAIDTSPSTSGDLIEISVADVVADSPHTIAGTGARAYFETSPTGMVIDGWFGDWESVQMDADSDASPVVNPNLNIQETALAKDTSGDAAYFYLNVENEVLGGASAPQNRYKSAPSSGGQPVPPVIRLKRLGGEDVAYIYIDSNTTDGSDGALIGGIGLKPDYMIRIKGTQGEVVEKELCHWEPGWGCTDLVQVGIESSRLEASAIIPGVSSTEMGVVFATTDWRQRGDMTDPTTRGDHSRGQVGPELMAPIWPATWISVVTDADDSIYPSIDLLEVYFNIDANYLYVRLRTDYRNSPPTITNYTWWIYLDTDGDNSNDWVVVEMSGSGAGEVHGLAWNGGSGQWGGTASDWYDTLTDLDDDSGARTSTMVVGVDTYGCVDFAVLRSEIGSISDDANIQAATNVSEDHNLTGNPDRTPPGQGLPYEYEDITAAGQIPEYDIILVPFLVSVIVPTVMIKRRKRYSGSQRPQGEGVDGNRCSRKAKRR